MNGTSVLPGAFSDIWKELNLSYVVEAEENTVVSDLVASTTHYVAGVLVCTFSGHLYGLSGTVE